MESLFRCPVCGGALRWEETGCLCGKGHRFDRARQGYVNLLLSGSAALHGDSAEMIRSRTAFLERGYYNRVREGIGELLLPLCPSGPVLDAGCGEGWYAAFLSPLLGGERLYGVDISREAVKAAARRKVYRELAVASAARLPVPDGALKGLLNIFSPPELGEYARVLAPGGILLRALPLEDHLWELKKAVYEHPYRNPAPKMVLEGFRLLETQDVTLFMTVTPGEDIRALFQMTPYQNKTSERDRAKLLALDALEVRLAIRLAAYRKE